MNERRLPGLVFTLALVGQAACTRAHSPFDAEMRVSRPPTRLRANEVVVVPVAVRNVSSRTWLAAEKPGTPRGVFLSYHWLRDDVPVVHDGLRTKLPADLAPDQEVVLDARVQAPPGRGPHQLQFDLVEENVSWFSEQGFRMPTFVVSVE